MSAASGLVDRCQSCHVATDPLVVPVVMTLTKADLGLAKSKDAPFTSHPDPDLLKFHPAEKFGCSPCHGGNGRALDTVEKAHGRYEHWLWPLYYPENYNAGCQQCHASDMRHRACSGAQRRQATLPREGLHRLPQVPGLRQSGRAAGLRRGSRLCSSRATSSADQLEIPRLNQLGDQATSNDAAQQLLPAGART